MGGPIVLSRRRFLGGAAAVGVSASTAGLVGLARPADAAAGCVLGVNIVAYDRDTLAQQQNRLLTLERKVGRRFNIDRRFKTWDRGLNDYDRWTSGQGRMLHVSWKPVLDNEFRTMIPWASVARGDHDARIKGWARQVAALGRPALVTFNHEPHNTGSRSFGTPSEHAAAFRRFSKVMRGTAPNARMVWVASDYWMGREYDTWFPGASAVNFIGADAYNFWTCFGKLGWRAFPDCFRRARAFATRHGRPWIVTETGSHLDTSNAQRKAQWIDGMAATARTWPDLRGIVYFHQDYRHGDQFCRWEFDDDPPALAAYKRMASSTYFRRRTL